MPVKTDDPELNEYAQKIYDALDAADVRVELDNRAEKLGYRMREGQVQKVPYLLVIGMKRKRTEPLHTVSMVRKRQRFFR